VNPRFFVQGTYGPGDRLSLPDDEAQHATRVLRLRPGAALRVFDGRGHEFDAVLATVTKATASVEIGAPRMPAPEARVSITVAHAVLKGDKMDDVVRDAVMIGAAAIQPIVTARSEVTLAALERARRRERWSRVALSSAKQCGRAVVPPVLDPIAFDTTIDALRALALPQPALMLIEPGAASDAIALTDIDRITPRDATIVIGPEGGWTPDEIERASAVCRLVRLGGRTLRADAMAIAAIAALFAVWGEY
jgi:16S rRNA (uracil1498-N3)-methyltransferase